MLPILLVSTASFAAALGTPPTPAHVVVVIEENHSFTQVIGSPNAPYMNYLAQNGALLTSDFAITHPSQPNYLHIFSGSNQNVTGDTVPPAGVPFSTANLAAALLSAGRTFGGYSEDLPGVGSTVGSSGSYVRRHNPWVDWQNSPQGLNQLPPEVNMPFTMFPSDYSTLPTVSFVVPNLQHDMHDGTVQQADNWLQTYISPYATWTLDNNSLLILAWDEDESASRNNIVTVFYGPMVTPGNNASVWTHHDLLRTIEDMFNLSHSGSASRVRAITGVFNSDPPTSIRTFQSGAGGYADAHDTWIESANPSLAHGSDTINVIDGSPLSQGLVRFDNIVGTSTNQIPPQATILSAKLMILTGSGSSDLSANVMNLHQMLIGWTESSTWNSLAGGVSINNVEASSGFEFSVTPNQLNNWAIYDVTSSLQAFSDDPSVNFGWLFNPTGTDGWRSASLESATIADRPKLSVTIDLSSCRPAISSGPMSQHILVGTALQLSVAASATTPLAYQWRKDGQALADAGSVSGANTSMLSVSPAATDDSGVYDVLISSNCGPVISGSANVSVCNSLANGDLNSDGSIDGLDISPMISALFAGGPEALCSADLNSDGVIDQFDVDVLVTLLLN